MNLKKKVLCGVLSLGFVCGGLTANSSVSAMMEDGSSPSSVAGNPLVNKLDEFGYTPLMNAVRVLDVNAVRQLIFQNASLATPKGFTLFGVRYTNVFEMMCGKLVSFNMRNKGVEPSYEATSDDLKAIRTIAMIITKYCIEHNISISVNTKSFYYPNQTTVWQYLQSDAKFTHCWKSRPDLFHVIEK